MDLVFSFFLRKLILSVLVTGKLLEKLLFSKLLSPFFFCTKRHWNREERHNRVTFYTIKLHLVQHLQCIGQSIRNICEDIIHLLLSLEPFLFWVEHTGRIIQPLASRQTKQMVMGLGIFLVYKVAVVGTNQFDSIFFSQWYQLLIGSLLKRKSFSVGSYIGVCYLMTLEFKIIVISKYPLIPL